MGTGQLLQLGQNLKINKGSMAWNERWVLGKSWKANWSLNSAVWPDQRFKIFKKKDIRRYPRLNFGQNLGKKDGSYAWTRGVKLVQKERKEIITAS